MTISPEFDANVTAYTATTSNATNKVTATASDPNATIEISKGIAAIENGSQVSWDVGVNVLTIKVTNGSSTTTYTVTVTKG